MCQGSQAKVVRTQGVKMHHRLPCPQRHLRDALRLAILLPLLLLTAISQVSADSTAGEVIFRAGEAFRDDANGRRTPLTLGDTVHEGERLITAPESHLHLRMVDGAFVVLRGDSELRIDAYRYSPSQPDDSRASLTLVRGVVRSVSGEIGARSRERFRLNTPVAAIGIRGTDFSVLTNARQSRLTVRQGGVAMARLLGSCRASGLGPCEASGMAELFASPQDALLEALIDDPAVRLRFDAEGPDDYRPPHPREADLGTTTHTTIQPAQKAAVRGDSLPGASSYEEALQQVERYLERSELARDALARGELYAEIQPRDRELVEHPSVRWGRFSDYSETPPGEANEISRLITAFGRGSGDRWYDAQNDVFGLVGADPGDKNLPTQGRAYFELNAYEAYLKRGAELETASISHPGLVVDFEQSAFAASLQFHADSLDAPRRIVGGGNLTEAGMLISDGRSPTEMAGTLTEGAGEAGLLFQRQLEAGLEAVGATHWVLDRE